MGRDRSGDDGWACATFGGEVVIRHERPDFWREDRRRRWLPLPDGRLVCPDLAGAVR